MTGSKEVSAAALKMALTADMDAEKSFKTKMHEDEIQCAAANFGGEFISSVNKIIERTVVAAKREGLIGDSHTEEGAVAGAAREAVSQIMNKAIGLNIGGKIGIARSNEHIAVAMFFGIGMIHLNEVCVGLGHRII